MTIAFKSIKIRVKKEKKSSRETFKYYIVK